MSLVQGAQNAFTAIRVCKLFHNYGRLDKLNTRYTVDEDLHWQMQYEALDYITDNVKSKYYEDTYLQKQYYFDTAMTEYYRLCQTYNVRFKTTAENNPYVKKAGGYVNEMMETVYDGFGYELQTKTNHSWSCRLVVYINNEYFCEYIEMVEALLEIFDFYKREVENLRAELELHDYSAENEKKEAA